MPRFYLIHDCLCTRLRLAFTVLGLCIMLFGFVRAIHAQENNGQEMAARNQVVMADPEKPTTTYVLNKLNEHLIVNQENMDHIQELQRHVNALEKSQADFQALKEQFALMMKIIQGVFGGVVTLLLKELTALLHIRLPKPQKQEPPSAPKN